MRRSLLLTFALGALIFASTAVAKGPTAATITGPGLDSPLSISGTEGSGDLGLLVQEVGFFPAAFDQSPDPMLDKRPSGRLGPRYKIVHDLGSDTLRQDLYPYAKPFALTYMKPGQKIFYGTTRGGWFQSPLLINPFSSSGVCCRLPTIFGRPPSGICVA